MDRELHRKVQLKQMEMMDAIHNVCVANNLRYYIIAGSCLGAVRHGGFIPWDIDIDVAMPREDYDKFFDVYAKELPDNLSAHTYKTENVFAKSHGLVCLKGSKLLTEADLYDGNIPRFGIFIDVMPLDKCSSNPKEQKRHKRDYLFVKKLRKYKLSRIYEENGIASRIVKHLLRFVLSPISVPTINKWQDKIMKRYASLDNCEYWCQMASKYKYEKQLMDKNIYGKPTLIKFEDRMYYAPEKTDAYLKKLYGDYMRLPSKDVQEKMYNYFAVAEWQE